MQHTGVVESGLAPLSTEQAAILEQWTGAMLVLGAPGTGKSTMVAQAALTAVREGIHPLVLVGDRPAASRLRNLITARLGTGTWSVEVTTVHGLARRLWQRFSPRPQVRLLNAAEQEFRVRELLAGRGPAGWPSRLGLAVGTRAFAAQVRACLARARQLGLDPDDLVGFGRRADRAEWQVLGEFFAEYLDVLDAEDVMDYAELIHRTRLLVADPQVRASLASEIGAVMVDDYADLDLSQIRLIAEASDTVPVLATADPDSVASAFRGADPRAVPNFADAFAAPGRSTAVTELGTIHRFGAELEQAVAAVRQRLPRPPGSAPRATQAVGPAGSVGLWRCADDAEQAAVVAAELHAAHLEGGIDFAEMAVLVRSGSGSEPIVAALIEAGIPVQRPGDEIPLAQNPAVRTLVLGLHIAAQDSATPDQAERLLTSPLGGFDSVGVRALARHWRQRVGSTSAPLEEHLAQALNDPSWAATDEASEAATMRTVSGAIAQARGLLQSGAPVDEVAWALWDATPWPADLAHEAALEGSGTGRANADLDAVCAFFDTATEADRRGGIPGLRAFLAELDGQQIPADRQRESQFRRTGVQVLTPHRARGQEWDLVVVAGVQEGRWPTRPGRVGVIDATELTTAGLLGAVTAREALAEERRLFHLACSRARHRLVATAISDGDAEAPSRFLAELGLPLRAAATAQPARRPTSLGSTTMIGLVAELRRLSADATQTPELRSAAAVELAHLADQRDDAGALVVPSADPVTWWGVRELSSIAEPRTEPIRLSPSQVGAVLTCPRRYFLGRQARAESGNSRAALIGSLIHTAVQRAVNEGLDLAQLTELVDQVWGRLPAEVPWLAAAERAEVIAALARFFAWWHARRAELIGVELPFRTRVVCGGMTVELVGQVDWLERTRTGLGVVDFKTARTKPTAAQVAGMDQLGIYQLAIAEGGFPDLDGAATGAAAVYLRIPDRDAALPKEFGQPSLASVAHLDPEAEVGHPTWVHYRVASAAAVVAEGRFPATPGSHCRGCAFRGSCPAQDEGRAVIPC